MRRVSSEPARPLLKWAGGKRQLLPSLSGHYPAQFDRYVEPFFGSGAVFFDLHGRGLLDGRHARLADVNPDLVGCYRTVRDQTDAVITRPGTAAGETPRSGRPFLLRGPRRALQPGPRPVARSSPRRLPLIDTRPNSPRC